MLIRTSERCPECDAICYLLAHPTLNTEGEIIVKEINEEDKIPHAIADGCYIDRDGVLCITQYDENTHQPDYYCIFCRWIA
tara:strand:+ start:258 stop:500 length:243 start_codon:yes stop_codon:yes gene_type:complete